MTQGIHRVTTCPGCGRDGQQVRASNGLCERCLYRGRRGLPLVGKLPSSREQRVGLGAGNPQRLPAPAPTPHRQGTPEKLQTLIERAEKKLELFHPADGGDGS